MADLYGLKTVPTFDIHLNEENVKALRKAPKEWVVGDFGYDDESFSDVSIRIKGHRSLRSIDTKPALKLRFNKGKKNKGRRFLGGYRVTLNNLVEDPTMIREYLAYRLAREVDLPVPKAGFANIKINGESRGLYLVVETPDKDFLKRQFGSGKGELYEGEYGCDLFVADVEGFDQDEGSKDRSELLRFAQAVALGSDAVWSLDSSPMTLDHLSMFLAFSTYVGDFDGYHHSHNYRIYNNPIDTKWQFMSWGLDRAFFKSQEPYASQGLLAKRCFGHADCRNAYLLNLRRVHKAAQKIDLATGAKVISAIISDSVNGDSKRPYSAKSIRKHRKRLNEFLSTRGKYVSESTECLSADGVEIDADGDGFGCMDCDDDNSGVSPGATEICDQIDNNCSGWVDESPNCPCPKEEINGETFSFCNLPMPYEEASSQCRSRGGQLASFSDVQQMRAARSQADQYSKERWWLGANDKANEGQFHWDDGALVSEKFWGKGEPDNTACNQDCTILSEGSKALLHDTHCGQHRPFICQFPSP